MSSVANVLLIFIGAGIGANARFWLGAWVQQRMGAVSGLPQFPWGTTMVNISGGLVMGVVAAVLVQQPHSPTWRFLVAVGLLGGYTTFSTFSLETVALLRDGETRLAVANILLSTLASVFACVAGYWASERVLASAS